MPDRNDFGLDAASTLIDAALDYARTNGLKPLAVVVLDVGGNLIAAKRQDDASLFRIQIATGKATGALGMGYGTRELAKRAAGAPTFYNGLMAATGQVIPSPGGVLIRDASGRLAGAVGISGDTGDADEAAAIAGIEAAAFHAQPGDQI